MTEASPSRPLPEEARVNHGYESPPMHPVPGLFQMVLAVYDRERGWITTKRSIIYGGRHGDAPWVDLPLEDIEKVMSIELRTGIRAIKYAWEQT